MAVVDLAMAKFHLNITSDADDALISGKLEAAQAFIEQQLGFTLAEEFPDTDDLEFPATVPADLVEAVLQMTAHYYENREASLVGVSASLLPFGVRDILNGRRNWSWS